MRILLAASRTRGAGVAACVLVWLAGAEAGLAAPSVLITGTQVLPAEVAREAAGTPPEGATDEALGQWARGATARIVAAYQSRGYTYARAWHGKKRDGTRHIHVDEGRMRLVFTGAGSISAFFYQVDLNLPHNVFHGPMLKKALNELRSKHDLLNVYHRVKTPGEVKVTPFGRPVPQRVLQIYIVRRERFGWGFDISLSATWGVLPGVSFRNKSLLLDDDHFDTGVEIAFPFRRYLLDEDPKITWVHGRFEAGYRLPRWLGRRLGLRPKTYVRASRYTRVDLALERYYQLRNRTLLDLIAYLDWLKFGLGVGLDVVWVIDPRLMHRDPPPPDPPSESTTLRSLWRVFFYLDPTSEVLRRDQRSYLNLDINILSETYEDWMVNLDLEGQAFLLLGRHRLIARLRTTILTGDVPFFDEVQLAGDFQRVFFGNRYWVHEAVQIELAYRVNLFWDWFEVGLFHDLSMFGNRTRVPTDFSLANGFGPSLHLLLFDMFSIGLYQGFGFSPVGYDYTFSFNLETIF
jgi:hypothetical protein